MTQKEIKKIKNIDHERYDDETNETIRKSNPVRS